MSETSTKLDSLIRDIRACRRCVESPTGTPLPHEPRPVLRVSSTARLAIVGQAPGTRVHASGIPFSDPSGVRLRSWMGVTDEEFYDVARIAIIPMGFCFPGLDAKGGDLPPRKECAPLWRNRLMVLLPQIEVMLLVGAYAQRWHQGAEVRGLGLTEVVADWRRISTVQRPIRMWPLPHPSWRNTGWIKRHPWFEAELVPALRKCCREMLR